jgi:hypothetical protein
VVSISPEKSSPIAEQEVSVKLGMDYLKNDTTISVNYERVQSTNNKANTFLNAFGAGRSEVSIGGL